MFLGLRTVIYHVPDLAKAKAWYTAAFGLAPYFDEPFYVGFNVGGYELGLHPRGPDATIGDSVVTYWGVPDIARAYAHLIAQGATARDAIMDVGEGIKVGTVSDPFGNLVGVIENPHFRG
jgi:predicted enzyme related to lactoylglutathione lyase